MSQSGAANGPLSGYARHIGTLTKIVIIRNPHKVVWVIIEYRDLNEVVIIRNPPKSQSRIGKY